MAEYCEHVYRHMGTAECSVCGAPTNEINWVQIHEQHRDWIASGKAQPQGWWSI